MGSPGRLLLSAATIAAAAVALTAAIWGGDDTARILVQGGLAIVFATFAVFALRLLHDIREQQRRIIAHLEIQARLMQSAARLARDHAEKPDITQ